MLKAGRFEGMLRELTCTVVHIKVSSHSYLYLLGFELKHRSTIRAIMFQLYEASISLKVLMDKILVRTEL